MSDGAPMPRPELLEAARSVQDFVESQGWRSVSLAGRVASAHRFERGQRDHSQAGVDDAEARAVEITAMLLR